MPHVDDIRRAFGPPTRGEFKSSVIPPPRTRDTKPPEATPKRGLASRIGGAIKTAVADPRFGKTLSQLGAAIAPRSRVATGLGELGVTLAESRSEEAFRERVAAGEDPFSITGGLTTALSGEQRSRLIGDVLRGKEVTSSIELRSALAERARAEAAAVGQDTTRPVIMNLQLDKEGRPAPAGTKNKFAVDPITGEKRFIGPVETPEEAVEKTLTGAEFTAIDKILERDFLEIATAEIEKKFEGTEQLREALKALDVGQFTGRVSTEKLFSALPVEMKREFRSRRAELERGLRSGRLLGEMAPELRIDTIEEFKALAMGELFVQDGVLRIKTGEDSYEDVE